MIKMNLEDKIEAPLFYKCKIIQPLLDLICSYIIDTNFKEALNIYKINHKFSLEYKQNFINYNIQIFFELYEYILNSYNEYMNCCNKYIKTSFYCGLKSRLVPLYQYPFDTYMEYVLSKYKEYDILIPIERYLNYNKDILKFIINSKIYKIKFISNALVFQKNITPYHKLSYFWKIIYIIMYISSTDIFPYHLHESFNLE
jgi:hypothetical protein